jgi:tRNA threonylcarbamoyladenosine biosynthesis protein TsaE
VDAILKIKLNNELATKIFAQKLAKCAADIKKSVVIYLSGEIGSGKTTLARGFIQYFGFNKVKSPTYSLLENYKNELINIVHIDCYRLNSPIELDYIGIREYLTNNTIQLIEWAEIGINKISQADLIIKLSDNDNQKGRIIEIIFCSKLGEKFKKYL